MTTPEAIQEAAQFWAERLGDDISGSPYFDDSCKFLIEVSTDLPPTVVSLTEYEYLSDHRTCARAFVWCRTEIGPTIRHWKIDDWRALKQLHLTAWTNPTAALIELAAVVEEVEGA